MWAVHGKDSSGRSNQRVSDERRGAKKQSGNIIIISEHVLAKACACTGDTGASSRPLSNTYDWRRAYLKWCVTQNGMFMCVSGQDW